MTDRPPALVRPYVKLCGFTREEDLAAAVDAGANAVGLNLWPQSPRFVSLERAVALAKQIRGHLEVVALVVDPVRALIDRVQRELAPDRIQVHGDTIDPLIEESEGRFYKAFGVRNEADVRAALEAPGQAVLIDARSDVLRGGTGVRVDPSLAVRICARREAILAGGLSAENVGAAIRSTAPAGVDVASGIEQSPGRKDPRKMRDFVARSLEAFSMLNASRLPDRPEPGKEI